MTGDACLQYVMRHGGVGGDFDQIARRKQRSNPRFAFMFGGDGGTAAPNPLPAKASLGLGLTAAVMRAEEYYTYVTGELTRRMALAARGAA